MTHPILKTVLSIVFFCIFLFAFNIIILTRDLIEQSPKLEESSRARVQSVAEILDSYLDDSTDIGSWFNKDVTANVKMMTAILSDFAQDDGYTGPLVFNDGFVAKLSNGHFIFPPDVSNKYSYYDEKTLLSEYTQASATDQSGNPGVMTSGRIAGDYYYIDWTSYDEYTKYVDAQFDLDGAIEAICKAYGGNAFVVDTTLPNNDFMYATEGFAEYSSLSDLGLDVETLLNTNELFSIQINDATTLLCSTFRSDDLAIVYCEETTRSLNGVLTRELPVILFTATFSVVLIIWLISLQRMVRNNILSETQKIAYAPRRVRRITLSFFAASTALILIVAGFSLTLQEMYSITHNGTKILDIAELRIQGGQSQLKNMEHEETEWYEYYGKRLAEMIEVAPHIRTREKLAEISNVISADSITLFDANGNELVSSSRFIDLSLGTDASSPTSDFRRILLGVESIVHEPVEDPITGLSQYQIGIGYRIPESPDKYGVILIAVDPSIIQQAEISDVTGRVFSQLASTDSLLLKIDPDTHIILDSSIPDLTGDDALQRGMSAGSLKDGYMDFFYLSGVRYYGLMKKVEDAIFCYAVKASSLTSFSFGYALFTAILYAAGFAILSIILLWGYNQKNFDHYAVIGRNVIRGTNIEVEASDGSIRKSVDPSKRWASIFPMWDNLYPEQKAKWSFSLLIGLIMLYLIVHGSSSDENGAVSVLSFVFAGDWTRGLNMFAVTAIIAVLCVSVLALLVLRIIFSILCSFLDTKGETICRLCINLLQYVVIIVTLYYSLSFVGIDTTTLLASVGLLSLAVSFGAQDLVKDILAGINIVFEGDYQVGDIVEINGYRGKVQEIGVRSTKLIGDGNNIKIIGNRDVKNVLNMTRLNSWYEMSFKIPITHSSDEIEQMLNRELPKIGAQIPEVISGPVYKGITSIQGNTMTITIFAEYHEDDLYKMQRKLTRAMKKLFNREGISLS